MRERWGGALAGLTLIGIAFALSSWEWGWYVTAGLAAAAGAATGGFVRSLSKAAERDELTGMLNRRAFERTMAHEFGRAVRYGRPLSLLFVEIDDFGQVNKQYGHLAGDATLRAVVREIRESVRGTDVLARWGGDEFVLLLPETDRAHAHVLAERIRLTVQECLVRDRESTISVTVSMGVAAVPGPARQPGELLRQAIDGQRMAKVRKNAVAVV